MSNGNESQTSKPEPATQTSGGRTDYLRPALAAIGAALLVGLGPKLWEWVFDRRPPIELKVFVFSSAKGNEKIPGANVGVSAQGISPEAHVTNPDGVASFWFEAKSARKAIKMMVAREGFLTIPARESAVPIASTQETVFLDPVNTPVAAATPPSGASSPIAAASSPPAASSPTTASRPNPELPREVQRVFTSGPKASGLGKSWSEWYELCSEPAAAAYVVSATDFALRGDRSCGAWSECRQTRQTSASVCYQFRLQGHDEWFPPRPAFSEGILRVTFVRAH